MQPTTPQDPATAALDAMRRLRQHLNRSAAQHKRAVRKGFAALRAAAPTQHEGRRDADN